MTKDLIFLFNNILHSPGANGDIFTPFDIKALTQNLKSLPRGNQFFLCHLGFF